MNSVTAAARIKSYATLHYYIFHSQNARSQKLMYLKLEIEVHIAGEKCFATCDILTSWHRAGPHPYLRDYRHYNINDIVVLVYETYSFFKDSAFTAVIGMQI